MLLEITEKHLFSSDDIKAIVTMHGNKMEKDGVIVYHFSDMKIKIKVHKGKIHLSNLFNGDKQLGEFMKF